MTISLAETKVGSGELVIPQMHDSDTGVDSPSQKEIGVVIRGAKSN